MEVHVVSEVRRPLDWFYDDQSHKYVRREKDGKLDIAIEGRFLPDPIALEDLRRERGSKHPECDPVTHSLWKHWTEKALPQWQL